jgi:tetratricopeptide (TPR) repeat protein
MKKNISFIIFITLIQIGNVNAQNLNAIINPSNEVKEARNLVPKADSLYINGQYAEAAEEYEKIKSLNPKDIRSIYSLAMSYYFQKKYEDAIKNWNTVSNYFEHDKTDGLEHFKRYALYRIACCYSLSNDINNGFKYLELAINEGFNYSYRILNNSDFDNLRKDPRYHSVLKRILGEGYTGLNQTNPSPKQIIEGVNLILRMIQERHPNPYRHFTKKEWQKKADDIISKANSLNETEYLVELIEFLGMAGDVHTSAFPSRNNVLLKYSIPIRFWKFEDGLYVRACSNKYKHLIGAKILEINEVKYEKAWDMLLEKFPSENESMSTYMIQLYLQFPALLHALGLSDSVTEATFKLLMPDSSIKNITILAEDLGGYFEQMKTSFTMKAPENWVQGNLNNIPLWLKNVNTNYYYEIISEKKTAYLQINIPRNDNNNPWEEFLNRLFDEINSNYNIEKLVVDVRNNEGGWDYMVIPLFHKIIQSNKINKPGNLFVLMGRVTQSAGVTFVTTLERETNSILVGEAPGAHPNFYNGAWGNHSPISLPGSDVIFRVSTHIEQWSDAIDDRHIIAPDIPVNMTYSDYEQGIDPVLDAALDFPSEKGHLFFEDEGGRNIEKYLPWRKKSQINSFKIK